MTSEQLDLLTEMRRRGPAWFNELPRSEQRKYDLAMIDYEIQERQEVIDQYGESSLAMRKAMVKAAKRRIEDLQIRREVVVRHME